MRLVIETATSACSVALIDDGRVIAATHREVGRGHAEQLLPMIAALPGGGRADDILVDCGPGSFTGIRVGIAAARALGFGWGVPVTGYSSLALLAAGHFSGGKSGAATIAIPGGHGEVFLQRYKAQPLIADEDLASLTPDVAARQAEATIIGSAAAALVSLRGDGTAIDAAPNARTAVLLPPALTMLPPRPIYGRGPDAKPMA